MFDDGDTDHILLETGHYQLVETGTSSGGKSKSSNGSKSKTEAPAEVDRSSCQQAMSRHKQHMSGPSAAGADKERERDKGSKSATREMRDKSAKQQQQPQHQASSNSDEREFHPIMAAYPLATWLKLALTAQAMGSSSCLSHPDHPSQSKR